MSAPRRLLTLPGYAIATLLVWAALPLLLIASLAADLVLRRRWLVTRLVLLLLVYLTCELAGLAAALALWLARPALSRERFLGAHWRLQGWWAASLFGAARLLFRLELHVEGAEAARPGPVVVFIRHASLADTLLPAVALAGPSDLRLRYVLKKELRWDPCLDVVGHRLPNAFVDRASPDSRAEIARVSQLASELGDRDGILIYPEGTRFTPARRERAMERLEKSGEPELYARAQRLRHVLPPRLGGPLALVEASPRADVLIVAHAGLDGLSHVRNLLDPSLVGRRIELRAWRVPRAAIPASREARAAWLYGEWERVDAWIDERLPGAAG